jgi:plasmid stabilization system protein ParE
MPRLIFSRTALQDLQRLRLFLRTKSPRAAAVAVETIVRALRRLESAPEIGRPLLDLPATGLRELVIDYGDSGYLARYHFDGKDRVVVLKLCHQREVGFR